MLKTNLVAVQLEFTNACRLKCAECPRILMSRPVGMMKVELAKLIVDELIAYNPNGNINGNGLGDSLLHPNLAEMIDYMDAKKLHQFDLFTSLMAPERLVNAAFDALERARMAKLIVVTKHLYDNHGNRQFSDEEFDRNLERVLSLTGNVDRHISMVLTKYHKESDWQEFEAKYGPKFPGKLHIIRNLNPWFNLVKDMAHPDFGADKPTLQPSICDYPFILLHVGWNGDVIICCTDDVDGDCVLGTIREPGDLKRIWEGPKMEAIRKMHNSYNPSCRPCNKCERTAWMRQPAAA